MPKNKKPLSDYLGKVTEFQFPLWIGNDIDDTPITTVTMDSACFPTTTPDPLNQYTSWTGSGSNYKFKEPSNKDEAISMINIKINALATQANRLAKLREFFKSLNSNQQDLIKEFWETVKKELD